MAGLTTKEVLEEIAAEAYQKHQEVGLEGLTTKEVMVLCAAEIALGLGSMKLKDIVKGAGKTAPVIKQEIIQWLGPKMQKRMKQLGFSEPKLEALTGIGASTLSDYFNKRYLPDWPKILSLRDALMVDLRFFEDENWWPKPINKKE